jgi:thioredoxin 1
VALVAAVVLVFALKEKKPTSGDGNGAVTERHEDTKTPKGTTSQTKGLPRLVDLGADKCVPCKLMAPILEELKNEYAGRLKVVFIDVWKNPDSGKKYGIKVIPTQIFYDASGKERFRHEGFFSKDDILAKWKEFGVDLQLKSEAFSRLAPAKPDSRPTRDVCYMCDGDIAATTRVTVKSDAGDVFLCSPHCYFITLTSLKDKTSLEGRVTIVDAVSGDEIPAAKAIYVYGLDEESGRPTTKAFADRNAALKERRENGGNLLDWKGLRAKELANRCGFCDRAVYPEDASEVKVAGIHTWGCCPMCALGVAARAQRDIECRGKDALTGEEIIVTTLDGSVRSIEPRTAVAWAGARKKDDGTLASTGCFKQAFFVTPSNLTTWVEKHPTATGKQITIGQALAKKMKMTPEQIAGACKIGECKPR